MSQYRLNLKIFL